MNSNKLAVNTYNKIAKVYSQKYFTDLSDTPYIDKFLDYLPKNARILDVGCGPGTFTKYLLDKSYMVEGIDLSEEMIAIAREKVSRGKFTFMDMRRLLYPDKIFDGLLVAYSLIHIPSEELRKTLQEFYRVLKPNGYILLITQKGKADQIVDEPFKQGEKMFFNFFTKKRLNNFLKKAQFSSVFQEESKSQDPDSMSDRIIYTIVKKRKDYEDKR